MGTFVIQTDDALFSKLMTHLPAELCVTPNPPRKLRADDAALVHDDRANGNTALVKTEAGLRNGRAHEVIHRLPDPPCDTL